MDLYIKIAHFWSLFLLKSPIHGSAHVKILHPKTMNIKCVSCEKKKTMIVRHFIKYHNMLMGFFCIQIQIHVLEAIYYT